MSLDSVVEMTSDALGTRDEIKLVLGFKIQ